LVELQDYVEDSSLLPLLVPQRDIEQLLEQRAKALGADVRRGQEVVGFDQDDDGVSVAIRPEHGPEYRLAGSYLVGCDGGSSIVRKQAGIAFPGTESTADGLTADVITPVDMEELILHPTMCPAGMYAAIPLHPGLYRVTAFEFGVPKTSKDIEPTVAEFQAKFRKCSGQDLDILATGEVRYLSRVGNATRLAEHYRQGRVFIAGDACHVHLPISGQGLNTGVQDAMNLGWKLAATLNGWAPPELLDTYETERKPVGERLCWSTRAQDGLLYPMAEVTPLRELFGELIRLPSVNRYLMRILSGLGVRYPMNYPGQASESAHEWLGDRVIQGKLTTTSGEITIASTLHAGHGVLVLLGAPSVPEDIATGWSGRVDVIDAEVNADIDARVLLIRPDGYVAYADRGGADGQTLRHALRTWFGEPVTS
jgi:2-polyprenyl-6-methoxyphenol hydroxylase-like FAD-dependent oxidoreductase